MKNDEPRRRLPIGAEPVAGEGVHFRVWAPRRRRVDVVFEGRERGLTASLRPEGDGYFSGHVPEARPGSLYRYKLDGGEAFPDPASRFQPEGPHGPSEVIDPAAYAWRDAGWRGLGRRGQAIYELHFGTFTREGTYLAAIEHLPAIADLGVSAIEVLPLADFHGRFGWGYDGVDLFAPCRLYGRPDDFRRFVDEAHRAGLGVLMDVVYNHFGPVGNYVTEYSEQYLSKIHKSEWGATLNYDDEGSGPVREYVLANATYWIDEFHLDGLRIDATHEMQDNSEEHILKVLSRRAREAAGGRTLFLVGENEPQQSRVARPESRGGYGLDALWNEDFHHVAMIAATGRREGYYGDYWGTPQEFLSLAKHGFLYQGQLNSRQGKRRGSPCFDLPPEAFVNYLQNHDQVANTLRGDRFHRQTSPQLHRALTAWSLLAPGTPHLFQGQEFAASTPFLYFCDQQGELGSKICGGRAEFLSQFLSLDMPETKEALPDPCDIATFEGCKLDHGERASKPEIVALHRDLLRLRVDDPAFRARTTGSSDGAVLGERAFVLRDFGPEGDDRLILVNYGTELHLDPAPEPLLAPPEGTYWAEIWSSEDLKYGGGGSPPAERADNWHLAGSATVVLAPRASQEDPTRG